MHTLVSSGAFAVPSYCRLPEEMMMCCTTEKKIFCPNTLYFCLCIRLATERSLNQVMHWLSCLIRCQTLTSLRYSREHPEQQTGDCGKQHREEANLCRNSTSGTYVQYVIETPDTAGGVSKTSHAGKAELLAVRSLWERAYWPPYWVPMSSTSCWNMWWNSTWKNRISDDYGSIRRRKVLVV